MKLSKKSWHYWIYSRFFSSVPRNLCPYFWKMVLCTIFIIPLFVLSVPLRITCMIFGKKRFDLEEQNSYSAVSIIGIILLDGALFFSVHMVWMWFNLHNERIVTIGVLGWVIFVAIMIALLVRWLEGRTWKRIVRVEKEPSIFKQYWKAKKDKICPLIEWED